MNAHNRLAGLNLDAKLSSIELLVARLVACGLTDHAIARSIYRSENTIKCHVRRLLRKTGTASRYELVAWLYEAGHLQPGARTFVEPARRPVTPQLSAEHLSERIRTLRVINAVHTQLNSALPHLGSL
ncbi:helix-turn-helix transcriptional regulator [Saccharopolyspora sp. NFXS83]|uniref:helix-turn-helix domain-containing protein n=1 Tax=Saccharopolyspora sp. NFXS83 TaxID=2993560 RepID=UPI00224B2F33|nr:helix-turn-helix transcriptional regulator [Saccharopolyspora sp. NFXS83]MCX2729455.1 helix-turn-helix transcriptional regulator [Saccharopolyspora sp. NFXS83]